MKSDLEALRLTEAELERLSGYDVNDVFVGGLLGGVYRPSIVHHRQRLLAFCFTEVVAAALVFVFALPLGLAATRNVTAGVRDLSGALEFAQVPIALTILVMVGWNVYMVQAAKRLRTLMQLLDEVDRYSAVIQAVDVLDRLEAVGHRSLKARDRGEILQALRVTRDTLVSGLRTEKVLRQSRGLLTRHADLIHSLETNLVALRALEVNHQASEYGQLLHEALQISQRVQQEVGRIADL